MSEYRPKEGEKYRFIVNRWGFDRDDPDYIMTAITHEEYERLKADKFPLESFPEAVFFKNAISSFWAFSLDDFWPSVICSRHFVLKDE